MLKLYRDLTIIYWIVAIAIALIYFGAAALLSGTPLSIAVAFLFFFLAVWVWATFLNRKASKRLNALYEDLLGQCRIREYLDTYHQLMQRGFASKTAIRNILLSNMAVGYNAIGDDAEAIRLSSQVFMPPNPTKPNQQASYLVHLHNVSKCYLDAGDVVSARRILDDLKRALGVMDPAYLRQIENLILLLEMRIRMAEGSFDGIRTALEIELSNENMLLRRIHLCYDLARIHAHEGDTEKEKEYLTYIQQYGGDSRYVYWAAARLQALSE